MTFPISQSQSIVDCVAYCHARGIIHSDIKPSNVLHEHGDTTSWKLIDFESARFKAEQGSTLTTPRYCAPEVALAVRQGRKIPAHESVDVWALGCILFEMYAGRPYVEGANEMEIVTNLTNGVMVEVNFSQVRDEQARNLLIKMLARDPFRRPDMLAVMVPRMYFALI